MSRIAIAAFFLTGVILSSGCRPEPAIRGLVDSLTTDWPLQVYSDTLPAATTDPVTLRFKRLGKTAIPYLIDAIDRDEKGWVGFPPDPQSSSMRLNIGYLGIRAAYMIEYMLSDSADYQIYRNGVICRLDHQINIYWDVLTYYDMKAVKRIYRAWWEDNKNKSMEELKKEWREGKRPLDSPEYAWI